MLTAMYGENSSAIKESIRISFGYGNTPEEIATFSEVLVAVIQQLKNNLIAAATGFRYNEDNNENNEVEPMAFTMPLKAQQFYKVHPSAKRYTLKDNGFTETKSGNFQLIRSLDPTPSEK